MSVPTSRRQENRLLPYLAAILAVLLAYVVYTRVIQRPAPVAVLTPVPVETTPSPAATATPQVARSPQPSMAAEIPARPIGRSNPFVPLVVPPTPSPAPAPRAAAPPPPPVPPPVFPEATPAPQPTIGVASPMPSPTPSPTPTPPPARLVGILAQETGGERVAIVQVGQKSYIVRVGDILEGFRVIRIAQDEVVLRQGEAEVSVKFPVKETSGEGEQR